MIAQMWFVVNLAGNFGNIQYIIVKILAQHHSTNNSNDDYDNTYLCNLNTVRRWCFLVNETSTRITLYSIMKCACMCVYMHTWRPVSIL